MLQDTTWSPDMQLFSWRLRWYCQTSSPPPHFVKVPAQQLSLIFMSCLAVKQQIAWGWQNQALRRRVNCEEKYRLHLCVLLLLVLMMHWPLVHGRNLKLLWAEIKVWEFTSLAFVVFLFRVNENCKSALSEKNEQARKSTVSMAAVQEFRFELVQHTRLIHLIWHPQTATSTQDGPWYVVLEAPTKIHLHSKILSSNVSFQKSKPVSQSLAPYPWVDCTLPSARWYRK